MPRRTRSSKTGDSSRKTRTPAKSKSSPKTPHAIRALKRAQATRSDAAKDAQSAAVKRGLERRKAAQARLAQESEPKPNRMGQSGHRWVKGQSGNPAGRRKGAKNKTTRIVKEMMHDAFKSSGGIKAFSKWAKDNRTAFYRLYARMLPIEHGGPDGGPVQFEEITTTIVDPAGTTHDTDGAGRGEGSESGGGSTADDEHTTH